MIAEVIAGVVKGVYDIIDAAASSSGKKESMSEHIVKNEFIQARLEALMASVGAGRIYIVQFHNGGYFYTGLPMQKFSCSYEAISSGLASSQGELQNKLVSEYPVIHSTILKDGEYYVPDVSAMHDNSGAKTKWENRGIKTFYAVGIWDLAGNLVGNVGVNYVYGLHEITEHEKEQIGDFAKLIVGYILKPPNKDTMWMAKLIFAFFGLMMMGQVFWFLNNFWTFVESLGPMFKSIGKALIDLL